MTVARQRLGRRGEELAAAELERRGWTLLARNARIAGIRGELDIVARDGGTLVFVEVKSGKPDLSKPERGVREAVEDGRVRWDRVVLRKRGT